jgi:hypothetical protein
MHYCINEINRGCSNSPFGTNLEIQQFDLVIEKKINVHTFQSKLQLSTEPSSDRVFINNSN